MSDMMKHKVTLDERTKAFCKASEGFALDSEKYMQDMRKLSEMTRLSCVEFSNAINAMSANGGK